jgi:hypothetical protein
MPRLYGMGGGKINFAMSAKSCIFAILLGVDGVGEMLVKN